MNRQNPQFMRQSLETHSLQQIVEHRVTFYRKLWGIHASQAFSLNWSACMHGLVGSRISGLTAKQSTYFCKFDHYNSILDSYDHDLIRILNRFFILQIADRSLMKTNSIHSIPCTLRCLNLTAPQHQTCSHNKADVYLMQNVYIRPCTHCLQQVS